MGKILYALEGVLLKDCDVITLCCGSKRKCTTAFDKMSKTQKQEYEAIYIQPYSEDEKLDFDELLYSNKMEVK